MFEKLVIGLVVALLVAVYGLIFALFLLYDFFSRKLDKNYPYYEG
jgi:hypothetical protein